MNADQPSLGMSRTTCVSADLSREVVSGLVHLSRLNRRGRVHGGGIGSFLFLPFFPLWSLLVIAVDVVIIWALVTARQPQGT